MTNNNISGHSGTSLFGTTSSGGAYGGGTVWGIDLKSSPILLQTLNNFGDAAGAGIQPEGKLAFSGTSLFGTTSGGGFYTNGTMFSINSDGTGFSDLYDFGGGSDGGWPLSGLTLAVADNVASIWSLGATINVSAANVSNLVYSIAVDNLDAVYVNGNFVSWTNVGGAQWSPYASLPYLNEGTNAINVVIGGDADALDYFSMAIKSDAPGVVFTNTVFGTTYYGGNQNDGTVFELTPEGEEADLHTFTNSSDGANPVGDLVLSGGTLYGVTVNGGPSGGSSAGTIFSLTTNGVFQVLHTFTNSFDGANPMAGLVLSGTTLYGTTEYGGSNGQGTIFSIQKNGSGYANLYSFAGGSDGANPTAPLLLLSNTLYGTASEGNVYGGGTIFSIGTNGSNYYTIYNFGTNYNDGSYIQAGLTFFSNTLYGVTEHGGTNGNGEIFRINANGSEYTNIYSFGLQPDGANPVAGLILSSNKLYGTTVNGGANTEGTIFSIGMGGTGYTVLQNFGSSDNGDPENPKADLIILGNSLYGTTYQGGAYNFGMVFSIGTNGTGFNDIYDFMATPDGQNPDGGICAP